MSLFDEADDILKRTNDELVGAKYREADELLLAIHDKLVLNHLALKWVDDPMKEPPLLTINHYKQLVRRLCMSNDHYRRCCNDYMNSAKARGDELIIVARRNREKDTIIEHLLTIVSELSGSMTNLNAKEYAVALQNAVITGQDYKLILNNIKNQTNDIQ